MVNFSKFYRIAFAVDSESDMVKKYVAYRIALWKKIRQAWISSPHSKVPRKTND